MSVHICSNCGHAEDIFGHGGGEDVQGLRRGLPRRAAADHGDPRAGRFRQADRGRRPGRQGAAIYKEIARKVAVQVAEKAKDMTSKFPTIVVKND
jgi:ATP-binding protein involved in chromosome partitioning